MTTRSRRREIFANPFFTIMLATSVGFVLTVLAYLASPYVLAPDPANAAPGAGSVAVAEWLDRNAPKALGIELLIMLVTGVVAMVTDPWFSTRSQPKPPE